MVGKTNLTFISKGDSSNVQLIQNSYVTDATGEIYKMEVINNRFFAFVGESDYGKKNVMMGTDAGNMSFVRMDNELLEATHIIHIEGKYYIVKSGSECTEIYETTDFQEYVQINLSGIEGRWLGMFLDSRGKAILISYIYSDKTNKDFKVYVCDSLRDIANAQVGQGSVDVKNAYNTCLINNRIFFPDGRQVSLAGTTITPDENNGKWKRHDYAGGYFFRMENTGYYNGSKKLLYRSRDLVSITCYPYEIADTVSTYIIPISGAYGYLYAESGKRFLNIANDILQVGYSDNEKIEIGEDILISSVLEDDGKTYLGTPNGVIYELQLDYEGTIQRPDVAIIKTMAAKQALAQSLQYTDECIAKIKSYIDNKFEGEISIVEDSSTKV